MIYTGIGSRKTPDDILQLMRSLGKTLAGLGMILRSGGAPGADTAFEEGCDFVQGKKEIYLPWRNFNGNTSPLFNIPDAALIIAERFHPGWRYLTPPQRLLMARNSQQIAGKNLDVPADFVICWTPDGCESSFSRTRKTGGTGQAIAVASACDIPVINLYNPTARQRITEILFQQLSRTE